MRGIYFQEESVSWAVKVVKSIEDRPDAYYRGENSDE
jgi:hypothetical protein